MDGWKIAGIIGFCVALGFVAYALVVAVRDYRKRIQEIKEEYGDKEVPAEGPRLVPCPDCGNMVSTKAEACPKCGRPLRERHAERPAQRSSAGIVIAVVAGILIAAWILTKVLHVEITGTITPMK